MNDVIGETDPPRLDQRSAARLLDELLDDSNNAPALVEGTGCGICIASKWAPFFGACFVTPPDPVI